MAAKTFGFGQSVGQIVQTAYVVQRIRPAIDWWINDGKAGPFFLLDSFTGAVRRIEDGEFSVWAVSDLNARELDAFVEHWKSAE